MHPSSSLSRTWLKRLLYGLLLLGWLLVMSFPIIAAILASSGQIKIGDRQSPLEMRLFLVQERSEEGVGLEWTRGAAGEGCRQGRILYAMWKGSGENAQYCTCFSADGSVIRSEPGSCQAGSP